MTVSTGLEAENGCDLDEDIDQAVRNFEFADTSYYVAVITFSLDEPVYIIEVKDKGRATKGGSRAAATSKMERYVRSR